MTWVLSQAQFGPSPVKADHAAAHQPHPADHHGEHHDSHNYPRNQPPATALPLPIMASTYNTAEQAAVWLKPHPAGHTMPYTAATYGTIFHPPAN